MAKKLKIKDGEKARNEIIQEQKKMIASLYEKWADEIAQKAKVYENKPTPSAAVKAIQLKELEKMIRLSGDRVSQEAEQAIKEGMAKVAQSVVATNSEWLEQLGFPSEGVSAAFSSVPNMVVQNLITGKIYESKWSLSKSIWGDNEDTMRSIYEIVAGGQAQNKSIYEIAKDLEQYVRPSAKKQWNLRTKSGRRIYPKQVDYNAQRLARTLSQHAYQQTIKSTSKENPFIKKVKWHSIGGRTCPLCKKRDGKVYTIDKLPMDHPNGMCIMEQIVDDNIDDRLIDWVNGKEDPELDTFAGKLGANILHEHKTDTVSKSGKVKIGDKEYTKTQLKEMDEGDLYTLLYDEFGSGAADLLDDDGFFVESKLDEAIDNMFGNFVSKSKAVNMVKESVAEKNEIPKKPIANTITYKGKEYTMEQIKQMDEGDLYEFLFDNLGGEKAAATMDEDGVEFIEIKLNAALNELFGGEEFVADKEDTKEEPSITELFKSYSGYNREFETQYRDWLDKLYDESAEITKTEAQALEKIGKSGVAALKRYTGDDYPLFNDYLRRLAAGESEEEAQKNAGISKYMVSQIKSAINGLNKVKLEKDYVFRRGTDIGELVGFMPPGGDFTDKMDELREKSIEELNDMFSGVVGKLGSFTSTSSSWDRGFPGEVEVIIYAPKGTHAVSVTSISQYGAGEGETIINANTTVKIRGIEESDGHKNSTYRIFMEIIVDD